jgi:type IV pilus assembly protein PilE
LTDTTKGTTFMRITNPFPRSGRRAAREAGFTLVELMIVVAVIGLLAGIAVPSYRDYVNKGKRSEGKAALVAAAARLERYYTQNNCYPSPSPCGGTTNSGNSADALKNAGINAFSGDDSGKASYDMSVTITPQAFVLTAVPRLPFKDTKCGNLTLSNTGRKWTQSNGSSDDTTRVDGCW